MVIMQKNDSKFHPNFPVIPKYIYFFKPLPGFMVKVAKVVLEFQQHFYWVKAFTIVTSSNPSGRLAGLTHTRTHTHILSTLVFDDITPTKYGISKK